MNHLWLGKVFTIPGPILNYEGGQTLMGLHLCRYRHLRTRDAPILALACPMPGLVGMLLVSTNSF